MIQCVQEIHSSWERHRLKVKAGDNMPNKLKQKCTVELYFRKELSKTFNLFESQLHRENDRETDGQTDRGREKIFPFAGITFPQIKKNKRLRAEPGQSSRSPTWVTRKQGLGPPSATFPGTSAGARMESRAVDLKQTLRKDSVITGNSINCCAMTLALDDTGFNSKTIKKTQRSSLYNDQGSK